MIGLGIIIGLLVGASVGYLLGLFTAWAKVSQLESENWALRKDLVRWQDERLEL